MVSKAVVLLGFLLVVFSILGDYTGAASRTTSQGSVYGWRPELKNTATVLKIVSNNIDQDGIPIIKESESFKLQLFPGNYVYNGIRISRLPSNSKVYGNFGSTGVQGSICDNKYPLLSDKVCTRTGPKCNCDIEIRIPYLNLKPGLYSAQVCSASYTTNQCGSGIGVISTTFKVISADEKIKSSTFFRGQTTSN